MAFCDSQESLSLVLPLHLHPCSNSLWVQSARILVITLFGTEATWAELEFGFCRMSCPHSSLPPLPALVPQWRAEVRGFICAQGWERGQRRRNARNFCVGKQKPCLASGPPTRLAQHKSQMPGDWGRSHRQLDMLEVEPGEPSPCLSSYSPWVTRPPVPLPHQLGQHRHTCELKMLGSPSTGSGL